MNKQTILLISDMRQVYLAEILTKKGHNVRCLDIRNSGTALEQLEKLIVISFVKDGREIPEELEEVSVNVPESEESAWRG